MQKKTKDIKINKRPYQVNEKDFKFYEFPELTGLKLHKDIGKSERIISLLNECHEAFNIQNLRCISPACGGFVPIEISNSNTYENIFIQGVLDKTQEYNILENIKRHGGKNIHYDNKEKQTSGFQNEMIFNDWGLFNEEIYQNIQLFEPIILTVFEPKLERMETYENYSLKNSEFKLYIPKKKK